MPEVESQRWAMAVELHDFGVRMYRQRIRAERPEASDEEVVAAVTGWLHHRPGAEHGDAMGVPSRRFG